MRNFETAIQTCKTATLEDLKKGSILTAESHKLSVSNEYHNGEYLSKIVYLLPYNLSGVNVCPDATDSCKAICLGVRSGHADMVKNQEEVNDTRFARMRRIYLMKRFKGEFMKKLEKELHSFCRSAIKKGMTPCFRFNGSSDLPFENFTTENGTNILEYFGNLYNLKAYDYTKSKSRMVKFLRGDMPSNYHLTFSYAPEKVEDCREILALGGNVAVAFETKKVEDFIGKTFLGHEVINGDSHDLRFVDPVGGYVIGLTKKGRHTGEFFVSTGMVKEMA